MCGGHCGPDRLRQDMHPLVSQQTQNIPTTKEKERKNIKTIFVTGRMYTLQTNTKCSKEKEEALKTEEVTFQRDFVKT